MTIPSELAALGQFFFLLLIFFVPGIIGSSVSYFVKSRSTSGSTRKKKRKKINLGSIVIGAIIPSVILSFVYAVFKESLSISICFGAGFFIGMIGDDLAQFFTSPTNTIGLIASIGKNSKMDGLKGLGEILGKISETMAEEDKEKSDDKDNNTDNK